MTLATFDGRKIALRELDANRLRELVDHAGIDVLDRRAREGMIQALADARRVDFSTLVGKLSRDELKAMWERLVSVWPSYDFYAEHSGRTLRVYRLDPGMQRGRLG